MFDQTYKSLRCLQLYVTLLNIVNRNLIFTWKLLSIGMCITSGYAAINHFKDHIVFGFMYYYIFLNAPLIYITLYEKAVQVSTLFRQAVQQTLLQLVETRQLSRVERNILVRKFRAMPPVAISVGQFHTLERTSVPVFADYVLKNIVSMLVAFG